MEMICIAYDLQINWFWIILLNRDVGRVLSAWKENRDTDEEVAHSTPTSLFCQNAMGNENCFPFCFLAHFHIMKWICKCKPPEIITATEMNGKVKMGKWKLQSMTQGGGKGGFTDNSCIRCPHLKAGSSHFGLADICAGSPALSLPVSLSGCSNLLLPVSSPSPCFIFKLCLTLSACSLWPSLTLLLFHVFLFLCFFSPCSLFLPH